MTKKNRESKRKKVLVVEDSPIIQNLTRKVFEFQEYEVYSTKDGRKVVGLLKKDDYEIVLLDINMPKGDGMTCIGEIRGMSDKKKAKIPVIAVTGNAEGYTSEEFIEAGFDAYVQKPVNYDGLLQLVRNYT